MFDSITGLPEGVVGFEAVGKVEASDYEGVLMPAIARSAEAGEVRLVLVLGDRFAGYSPGAMREDAGPVSRAKAWKRTAVLSDLGWVAQLATAFGWMVPGKFRQFGLAERDAAIAWTAQPE